MQFGLMIHHGPEMAERNMWDATAAFALAAESSGFASVWLADHFQIEAPYNSPGWSPMLEVFCGLSALAAITKRVQIGQLVIGYPYRNPALTAKMATSLDIISHGRSILGIGGGWHKPEYDSYGWDDWPELPERLKRLEDAVQLILAMWGTGHIDYAGKYYRAVAALNDPPSVQRPHPPLLIGGSGEKVTLKLVAKYADWANCMGDPASIHRKFGILREHCQTVGRDYDTIVKSHFLWTIVGRTESEVAAKIAYLGPRKRAFFGLSGTPSQLVDKFGELASAGVEHCIIQLNGEIEPEIVELFGEEVIPKLADA